MNRFCTLSLILFLLPSILPAQVAERCGTMYMDSIRYFQNPHLTDRAGFEHWLEPRMRQVVSQQSQREVYTIPVVVHVVHDNEAIGIGRNISEVQVQSQIDVLNEDFRRMIGTPGYNTDPVGADVEIEFCLATVDPNGDILAEPGIDRINRQDFQNWPAFPWSMSTVETFVTPFTIWDPDQYMNIYVVELSGNNLGFAQFPDTDSIQGVPNDCCANTDAVTIDFENFGRINSLDQPYDQGRTTTHEVGHWLGLLHIWGDGDCSDDDFCDDTPDSDQPNYSCSGPAPVNCGSADMYQNYMDYSDDACMNIFTQCQATRMRTVMQYSPRRAALLNSNACTQQVAPVADFQANFTTVCEGSTVSFQDLSGNANSWNWTFENGNPATSTLQNPQVVFSTAGSYKVTLNAGNAFGSTTEERDDYITVTTSGLSTFFTEDFEASTSSFDINNPDNSITWERRGIRGSQNGSAALWINLYDYTTPGQRDEAISPIFDLSAQSNVELRFQHAYRPFSDSEKDSLLIYVSTDGGNSWPFQVAAFGENGNGSFATNAEFISKFIPANDQDWCYAGSGWSACKVIDLSAFDGEENFRFKFVSVNDYGNCITIDNIELAGVCSPIASIDPPLQAGADFNLYPNPTQGLLNLEVHPKQPSDLSVRVLNTVGQSILERAFRSISGYQQLELDISKLVPGTYIVEVSFGERRGYQRIIRQP